MTRSPPASRAARSRSGGYQSWWKAQIALRNHQKRLITKMFRTLNITMSLGSILCCFGCLFGVYFGAIWGSIWGQVGVNLGSIWGPKSDFNLRPLFNTFLTPFRNPLGPQVGPNLEALGRLGAVLGPFISDLVSNTFSSLILDRFQTPNRPQN